MGGEPYDYFVKYNADIDSALQELRNREFEAGRYNPVFPDLFRLFPLHHRGYKEGRPDELFFAGYSFD